ncbi:MAG TPA: 2-succinyl-6-hydroxy-2,4-cyclohexadiene-1-carboxylate synthase [Longimicrobiales bacterium]|nr:2-succinyl-6-hydroxy-2,4-cyclohexadiene-1-carboxylate synthase [Longimicrobiales bacterium]
MKEDGGERRLRLPGGETVRVRVWGSGGTPIFLLHGFLGSAEEWGGLPGRLGRTFHVMAVDLPGHGGSDGGIDPACYGIPRVAREMAWVQEAVFGGPAWWLGYSMGGRIALAAAVEGVPMRGLLLESASPGIRDDGARRARRNEDEIRARALEEEGTAAFVDRWLALPLFSGLADLPAAARDEARRIRTAQDPGRMAAWLRGGGTGSQPSYWEILDSLEVPVHLLVGDADEKFVAVARSVLPHLRTGSLTVVPGAGHLPHLEAPGAWEAWVREAVADPGDRQTGLP